jgi:serine/threonine-protein kinase RsbT
VGDETRIAISSDSDIVTARQTGRGLALQLGFSSTDLALIATAISEVARNMSNYAGGGEIVMELSQGENGRQGIVIIAVDRGPGIPDIDLAMKDGYSTGNGLGLGLPGSRRLMDEFEVQSEPGKGTKITMKKWRPRRV